jgi:hypothetical protein
MAGEQAPLVPCPFVYDDGQPCTGHIAKVKAFKAALSWVLEGGSWRFGVGFPRTHYHLRCSEKGSPDISKMKFFPGKASTNKPHHARRRRDCNSNSEREIGAALEPPPTFAQSENRRDEVKEQRQQK